MKMECINTITTFRTLTLPAVSRLRSFEGLPFAGVAWAVGGGSGVPIPGDACVRRRRMKM
jgi:hypothetical protein